MDMTKEYLDNLTLIADFWIADTDSKIQSFANEGITVEKSKIYLNKYFVDVFVKKEHYHELHKYAYGWEKRYPKAIITKASGKVEAYELTYKKATEKDNNWMLEFAADLIS